MKRMQRFTLIAGAALLATAAGAAADPLLVTPQWLAAHLNDPGLVLLHVGPREEYDAGHIPGARHVQQRDVSAEQVDGKTLTLEMSGPERLRGQLEALGISDKSRVVLYFGKDWVSPTTRILFTLDAAGLGQNASLLDGGMPLWQWENRPLSKDAPAAVRGSLAALAIKPLVVDAAYVREHMGKPGYVLIDGRSAEYYTGSSTGSSGMGQHKTGHIAGAGSLPFDTLNNMDMTLKSAEQLRAMFAAAGYKAGDTIIGYCHIGQQATAMLYAARLLGYKFVLYDGAFEDWSRRDLPTSR